MRPPGGDPPHRERRDALLSAGLLVGTGLDGLYGRSAGFERIIAAIEGLVTSEGERLEATVLRFPPVLPRTTFLSTDYLASFPDLAGEVWSFEGGDREHAELLARVEAGQAWGELLEPSGVVLCPAVCHPLYATLPSTVPDASVYDLLGWSFRNEPSLDPARQMAFRMHELVFVGDAAGAIRHRDSALEHAMTVMTDLGLDATSSLANDPFFGRAGRMLQANQRASELKYEVLAPTSSASPATAIVSANYHEDHFGAAFDLCLAGGSTAHTACVGYGLERIVLALLWAHGTDLERWPRRVQERLWP